MTLRELIQSVDSEQYSDSALYQKLHVIKPEYGSNTRISVRLKDGELTVSNTHIGSLGDIIAYPIDVDPELQVTKVQLMDAILKEMSIEGFTEADSNDFWDDMMDLLKAKNIR